MEQHNHAILRMHCPDQSGIITVITGFINENGGNILYLDQYSVYPASSLDAL